MEVKLEPLLDTLRIVDIDDKEYFGPAYTNYVSNSRMKLINPDEGGSYELYKRGFSGNSYSESLRLGTFVHSEILSPNEFDIIQSTRPNSKLGFVLDVIYNLRRQNIPIWKCILLASDRVDYYKGKLTKSIIRKIIIEGLAYYMQRLHETSDKVCLYGNKTFLEKHKKCVSALKSNPEIANLLNPSYLIEKPLISNEQTILLDVKATYLGKSTILKLKAKLDNFTYNSETGELILNDLKTTGKPVNYFDNSFRHFVYYRQAAFYSWLLRLVFQNVYKLSYTKFNVNFLVVSTSDYSTLVRKVHQAEIDEGWYLMVKLMKMIAIYQLNEYDISKYEYEL